MTSTTKLTNNLLQQLDEARAAEQAPASGNLIHVSEITSLPSFVYEKLRNIVDYKDEYLLRKNAIRRFFKRSLVLPKLTQSPEVAAKALVRELVLSRYLKNDSVPESSVATLAPIFTKYYELFAELTRIGCNVPRWREQVQGIAAVECDSHLVSPAERNAYVSYGYQLLQPILELPDALESDDAKKVQLVVTLERVLERADRDIINYYLLRHYFPDWFTLSPIEAARWLAPQTAACLRTFAELQDYRLGRRLLPPVKRLLVPLITLRDLFHTYDGSRRELLTKPHKLESLIKETYQHYWQATRKRIRRKGFHAMAYIFLTKMLLALLLEIPYERVILQQTHLVYLPLAINLIFPPILMLIITLLIKSPEAHNEARVVQGVNEMLYGGEVSFFKPLRVKTALPKFWRRFFYGLLYLVTFGATFGLLVWVLSNLQFNLLSGALFIFFASLVSFFGISLRQQARQLKVIDSKETFSGFVVDFFTLPIVAFGKWLSTTFDKVNIFVFFLDFLFEMPFKSLLKMIEDWFAFLKEKKDEMY
jgi:hypothetical protein